jgi:hypothetical protein
MSLFKKPFDDKKPEAPSTSPHSKAAAAAPRGPQAVVYSARSKPAEPWMIGNARVMYAFGAAAELRAQLGKHSFPPAELASGMLAFLCGDASQLVKDPDGLFRLAPATRAEIVRLCVYSGDKELVMFTDQPLAKDAPYKFEGKADVAAYATMLSLKVGVGPDKLIAPSVVEHLPPPSQFWRCPQCRAVLKKGLNLKDLGYNPEVMIDGTATCTKCNGQFAQSDVYDGRYDLPEVKMSCPNCRTLLQYAAEELLGKPCPKCHVNLPFE